MSQFTCVRNYKPDVGAHDPLNVLVLLAHPDADASFNAAVADSVVEALVKSGHKTRVISIGAGEFDPVIDKEEHDTMYTAPGARADLNDHIKALQWANGIVYVYPTWWSSVPAALKGWIDRVLLPGVAYAPPSSNDASIRPLLNIKKTAVITTTGGPSGQEPDLGAMLLTDVVPRGCYKSGTGDMLVCKLHLVSAGAPHLGDLLKRVYNELRTF